MISSFCGEHEFLSNFYSTDIHHKSYIFKSAEHLYQAFKCIDINEMRKIIDEPTAKGVNSLGRLIKQKPYWETFRSTAMLVALRLKFKRRKLMKMLRATGDKKLINVNNWHDTFWGVCDCTKHKRTGMNILGQLLMRIRAENNSAIHRSTRRI